MSAEAVAQEGTAPSGLRQTTTATYNARGDPLTVTDPRGNRIVNGYDDARRLVQSVAPPPAPYLSGITTTYGYDPAGRVVATAETLDGITLRTTSSTYTPSGKVARTTDPNGNVTRWTYDVLDRQATVTDALGRQTQYGYDRLSRVTAVSNPGLRLSPPLLQQAWTPNGQRASLTDANINTTAFAYDGFDRLSTTTWPGGSTEVLTYDVDSNVATRKTRAGATIAYGYDTLNRLVSKTPPTGPAVTYAYDRAGRLARASDTGAALIAAAPPGGAAVEYANAYAYDALNRPTGASWSPTTAAAAPGTGASVTFGHTYNAANQRSGQTVTDTAWLAYPAATPSTTGYTANSLNQYTAVGAVSPTYDGNGNLTSDGTWTLGYDAENRLISASAAGTTATYAYDGRGQRKSKTVNGTTTVFVTDADNREVLEYDGSSGAILRWHAYALGPNDVLGTMDLAAGTRTAMVPDVRGSVVGIMNAGTGALTPTGYLPYGGSNTTLSALPGFAYTGQRVDRENGFYYYRARHYSTAWGRFLQPDPIGYAGGISLYAYVNNNPLNRIDPTGLAGKSATDTGRNNNAACNEYCGGATVIFANSPSPGSGPFEPGGIVVNPVPRNDPLDPGNLNVKPPSQFEQQGITNTLNAIIAGGSAADALTPHRFENDPTRNNTGALLPPPTGTYYSFDVSNGSQRRGMNRLIIDSGSGTMFYTNQH